jgi:hypothetical protein
VVLAKPQLPWVGFPQRAVPLERRFGSSEPKGNLRRGPAFEKSVRRGGRKKASRGEPQERIWDEISPIGRTGSKASRG